MADTGKYLGDAVYGALDGIVTTFAVVAGVVGAGLSSGVILIMGFANLLGDGISMAAGNYLGKRSEIAYRRARREEERADIAREPDEHRRELMRIYRRKGFSGPRLSGIVATLTRDRKRWTDEMMIGELGIYQEDVRPARTALATFAAFVLAGLVPLISYLLAIRYPALAASSLSTAVALTGVALFVVGGMRSLIIRVRWWRAGLEMLVIGGLAAGTAYLTGFALRGLA